MPSEEELSISKLYGFKIVQEGRILLDEIVLDDEKVLKNNRKKKGNFASSTYSIPPNAKEIELPSFLDD